MSLNYPLPKDENLRLQALYDYAILDTMSEEEYENITKIAAQICNTPASLITFLDKDRQWFKSHLGIDIRETPREFSFCNYTILDPTQVTVVPDLRTDTRFSNNPLVTQDPHAVFYAGAPLVTPEGFALGSICVLDGKVNDLNAEQIETLKALARQVVTKMELQKKIKELTLTQEALQKVNKNLKNFAKIVSHDMKTPLANISLVTRSFELSLQKNIKRDPAEYFELINRSVDEMLEFIDEILIQSERVHEDLISETTDSGAVVRKVIGLLAAPSDIDIEIHGHFPTVQINKTSLQQILQNLISNAIKYNNKEKALIRISSESNSSFHYFIVSDNGSGIEQKHIEKIFEDRQILEKTDRFGKKGTGLGLATVKNIVESNGGTIAVQSVPDEGTRFKFSIPRILNAY